MELNLRTLRRHVAVRPRVTVLASTLAMSTALTTWAGSATAADGAPAATTIPAGTTTTTPGATTISAGATTTEPSTAPATSPTTPPTTLPPASPTTPSATTTASAPAPTPAPATPGAGPTTTGPAPAPAVSSPTSTCQPQPDSTSTPKPKASAGRAGTSAKCSPTGAKHKSAGRPHQGAAGKARAGHTAPQPASHHPAAPSSPKAHPGASATPKTSATNPAPAAAAPATTSVFSPVLSSSPSSSALLGNLAQVIGNGDFPPSYLIPIYKSAGRRYDIPWQILAAINGIETNYGRNLSVSSAGAIGWMQFMPATWTKYAVSVAGGGKPDPYNPRDAIYAAAALLAANGGAHDIRGAVFAYNHANWYVDAVIWRGQLIGDWAAKDQPRNATGYALPLAAKYLHQLGRTDEGVDIETAPDGAAVYSMTPGVITAVASDPTGFGPNYPVVRVTSGPLSGHYIYYGHVASSLVHVGQHVAAGQPIAVMGHTGDAASLGHGHIEIGFSDASGNPLNHPGTAATASGSAMRSFLIELSGASGIHNS